MKIKPSTISKTLYTLLISFFLILIIVGIFLFVPKPQEAKADGNVWKYMEKITINHTKVADNLTNFPILIQTTNADLKDISHGGHVEQSDGGDIKFVHSSTKLDYEIEKYSSSTGELIAWVKVDSLSSSTDADIYMYYGNDSCSNQWDNNGTWDNNYITVHHLHEAPANGVAGHLDSTSYMRNGTPYNFNGTATSTTDGIGKVGRADVFDGIDDYLAMSTSTAHNISPFTISFWFKTTSTFNSSATNSEEIIESVGSDRPDTHLYLNKADGKFYYRTYLPTDDLKSTTVSWNGWNNVVVVYNGTKKILYVNGTEENEITISGINLDTATSFQIGKGFFGFFNGTIDEVEVSNVARSLGWITTSYNTINDNQFLSYGSEEPNNGYLATAISITSPFSGSTQDFGFNVSISDPDSGGPCYYRVLEGASVSLDWTARTCNSDVTIFPGFGKITSNLSVIKNIDSHIATSYGRVEFIQADGILGKYYLYYATGVNSINLMYSDDGLNWTDYAHNPIATGIGRDIDVKKFAGSSSMFDIFYTTTDNASIKHLGSTDGYSDINAANGTTLFTTTSGAWDSTDTRYPGVVYFNGQYHLYYMGRGADGIWRIGKAVSNSPGSGYTKSASNPIINPGQSGFDDIHAFDPHPRIVNGRIIMYYTGGADEGPNPFDERLGMAYSDDGVNFTKYSGNPIIPRTVYQDEVLNCNIDIIDGELRAIFTTRDSARTHGNLVETRTTLYGLNTVTVEAYSTDGFGNTSNIVSRSFSYGVPEVPTISIPTVLSSSAIRWNFTDNADNETGFRVYTNADAIATSSATANLTYLDETGLSPNTQYSGRYVKKYNSYGESAASATATAVYTLANQVSGFSATNATTKSNYKINLTWTNQGQSGVKIEQDTNCDGYETTLYNFSTTNPTLPYEVSVSANTCYKFRISSYNGDGVLNTTSIPETNQITAPPAQPTGLTNASSAATTIIWDWNDVSGATGYKIYRVSDDQLLTTINTATSNWTQDSLNPNTQYSVYVRATNGNGEGIASLSASAYTSANSPTNANHSSDATSSITWTWSSGSSQKDFYAWTNTPSDNSGWTANTFWQQSSLSANTQYTCYIKARNESLQETSPVSVSAYTAQNTPTGISFDSVSADSIIVSAQGTLSNLSSGSSGLYFSNITNSDTSGWTQTNSWNNSSLSPNTQYAYKVKARNGDSDETSYTATSSKYTLADTPTGLTTINTADQSITVSVDVLPNATSGSSGYYFLQGSHNSGWIQTNSWQDTGLGCSGSYTYSVKYRNGNGVETSAITQTFRTPNCAGAVIISPQTNQQPPKQETDTNIPTDKPISQMSKDEIKAKITQITQVIAQLQSLLTKTQPTNNSISTVPNTFTFQITLKQGITDIAVKYLQIILNQDLYTQVAQIGIGSKGKETTYFGPLTKQAVIKFQEKYKDTILKPWGLTKSTSIVGKTTRDKLNSLLGN